ncbi:MAG TPA: serine/threonine-protein kinase [Isosphaeraceae bacterium]|nr:serine/threonine-protein kinase [Isosphaeraceae bacterium]
MASFERPKSADGVPLDLLPVIRNSGVLSDKLLGEIRTKVLRGDYPLDSVDLAERLVRDKIITSYQAKRFLNNRSHGLIVGRYIILDRIGSGSMGRVYKAHHVMMDRVVALKIIAPEIASNERVVARFQREMKLVGRLDHPNVVRAFDADQIQRVLYIVMEYVPGQSLGERLKKGPIPVAEMIEYAAQASRGLAHAHEQGIVHRDIKPSNILLTREGRVKILDLGLGVLMEADSSATFATADGIAVGTVDYMSPEQACGRDVDGRSDVYGLGCAMYHLLTGKLPFPGSSPIERLGKRISGRHVPITEYLPDVAPPFVRVLDKMLAHKPHERFASAAELAQALENLIRPRPQSLGAANPSPAAAAPPAKPAAADSKTSGEAKGTPAAPQVVTVRPTYPAWFAPLAGFAEQSPRSALASVVLTLALTFVAGILLGLMF